MLVIAGYLIVNPNDINAFESDARAIVGAARVSEGNLLFALATEDRDLGRLVVLERWRDEAVLADFLSQEIVFAFFRKWSSSIGNELRKFDVFNERSSRD